MVGGVLCCMLLMTNAPDWTDAWKDSGPVPVVFWHGLGDNAFGASSLKHLLEEEIPGVYIASLKIGGNIVSDTVSGILGNLNNETEDACRIIAKDPNLAAGYNAIGLSQGGLFLRAVAQRCPDPPMKTLVTMGGPHQGVYGLPHCPDTLWSCDWLREGVSGIVYARFFQEFVVPAQYWNDPKHSDRYIGKSGFLADINNERVPRNDTYRENLRNLENLVMVKYLRDTMIFPKETAWFGFYSPGQATEVTDLHNQTIYTEDWLGLKELDDSGRLHFLSYDGPHLSYDDKWFIDNVIDPFLK